MKTCNICLILKNDNEFKKGRRQCKKCINEKEELIEIRKIIKNII